MHFPSVQRNNEHRCVPIRSPLWQVVCAHHTRPDEPARRAAFFFFVLLLFIHALSCCFQQLHQKRNDGALILHVPRPATGCASDSIENAQHHPLERPRKSARAHRSLMHLMQKNGRARGRWGGLHPQYASTSHRYSANNGRDVWNEAGGGWLV